MDEMHVVRNYFAQWRRTSTNRWSRIHWFVKGVVACGIDVPEDIEDFVLPPEPILTCMDCQRRNRKMMVANGMA